MLTLDDLLPMTNRQLHEVVERAHPLPLEAMENTQYLGVDLSLPKLLNRVLWKTFRKTFHRDPSSGVLRGWNVRMEQNDIDGPQVPLKDGQGRLLTFGHYHVRSAEGRTFPRRWRGPHYLDYGVAGNRFLDPGRFGYTPLVAVNEGSHKLLLGWEVMRVGRVFLPIPDYWALRIDGPLDEIIARPT